MASALDLDLGVMCKDSDAGLARASCKKLETYVYKSISQNFTIQAKLKTG